MIDRGVGMSNPGMSAGNVAAVQQAYEACAAQVEKVVVGQQQVLGGAFAALLSDGHVLLEGVPGVAKTLLVRALAAALDCRFRRIQFTPDLMPSDVTGSMILREGVMEFRKGPLFTDLLLGDEINRAPAKTQSALLEAMQERAVTSDGQRFDLGGGFTVFATQNPVEQEGTYPLPEAELDRFTMKLEVGYPDETDERAILSRHHGSATDADISVIEAVIDADAISALKAAVRSVAVSDPVVGYVSTLVRASRTHLSVAVGASPRAGLNLLRSAKAWAAMAGRGFVTPDDVKRWAHAVLRHRLVLMPGAEIGGTTPDDVVDGLLDSVAVPT